MGALEPKDRGEVEARSYREGSASEFPECFIDEHVLLLTGFPGGSEYACNAEDAGLIPGQGRSPGGGHGNPLQYPCLENPHGQRSLVGYSPWGHKKSDTTEQLTLLFFTCCYIC